MSVLNQAEVEQALRSLPEWRLQHGRLVRNWVFSDFPHAMRFITSVADAVEAAGHHPDIDIRYNRVTLGLSTHDAGGGITERDLSLARTLDSLPGSDNYYFA